MQIRVHVTAGLAAALLTAASAGAVGSAQSGPGPILQDDFPGVELLRELPSRPVNGFPVEVPSDAVETRIDAVCVIVFDVEASGRVDRGSIEAECGDEAYDAQARAVAQDWTFEPRIVDGEAAPRIGEVRELRFRTPS